MAFVNNFLLYKNKCWSSVFLFVVLFSLAHNASSRLNADTLGLYSTRNINDIPTNFKKALFVERDCQLTAFNIDDVKNFLTLSLSDKYFDSCSFDVYLNNAVYHTYYSGSITSMSESDIEMNIPSNHNVQEKINNIYDIAVDFTNKKLYMVTVNNKIESDKLMVVDMITGHTGIVITDLSLPKHIELDPFAGFLFIQQQSSILKANMDGTSRVKIIERKGISTMAIDRTYKAIFLATSASIERTDYHGKNFNLVTAIARPTRSLAVLGQDLFWLSTPFGLSKPNTTVSRCYMKDYQNCDQISIDTIPFKEPQSVKAYDFEELRQKSNMNRNPCEFFNAKCQHLCLVTKDQGGSSTYRCACEVGYILNSDMYTCKFVSDKFLLYIQDNYAKGRIIGFETDDSFNFVDAIYPNGLVSDAKFISFDYDYQENYIYFTDNAPGGNTLYAKKLDATKVQVTVYNYLHDKVFATAMDWLSKNIYQLTCHNSTGNNCTIIVHRYPIITQGKVTRGYSVELLSLPTLWEARSMVVHPLRGFIFMTINIGGHNKGRLFRANLDGTNLLSFQYEVSLYGLAIDLEQDFLYWFNNDRTQLISYGFKYYNHTEMIDISVVKNPTSVSICDQYAYVGNLTTIWRFEKDTGKNPTKVIAPADVNQPKTIVGTKIYGNSSQPNAVQHPCAIDNGGCQKFCFPIPISGRKSIPFEPVELLRQCGCVKGERLSLDGLSCGVPLPQEAKF